MCEIPVTKYKFVNLKNIINNNKIEHIVCKAYCFLDILVIEYTCINNVFYFTFIIAYYQIFIQEYIFGISGRINKIILHKYIHVKIDQKATWTYKCMTNSAQENQSDFSNHQII